MIQENDIPVRIVRLLSGEAEPGDKKIIETWLRQSPENISLFNDLKDIWLTTGTKNGAEYKLEEAITTFRERVKKHGTGKKGKLVLPGWFRYAALFLFIVGLPVSYFAGKKSSGDNKRLITVSCAFGDKSSILLPDSSKVCLNSGSRLSFNSDFKNEERKVFLEGEAFFSVKKDHDHPFRVKTNAFDIVVLGTEFNLKAYREEPLISATLVSGSVKVTGISNEVTLKPYQQMVYNRQSKKMGIIDLKDLAPETEWKEGRLVFRNESLEELELKLERWFDVDILFADETVKKRKFTGILERESILETVSYFGRSNLVGYKIQENTITFYSEN